LPVRSQRDSTKASQLAVPIVKAGNSTWKLMTNPNWIRDNNNASKRRLRLASEIRTSLGLYP
jgi:hypothetical protein